MMSKVLGRFAPSHLDTDTIRREFGALSFLPDCCKGQAISVRAPVDPAPQNLVWHHDGGEQFYRTIPHMVTWVSEEPMTEFRDADGNEIHYAAGDVVWFDNIAMEHRQPDGCSPVTRWFVAIACRSETQ